VSTSQQTNNLATPSDKPPKSAFVLLALVTGAIVSNISLSIANVALPSIGRDLNASQSDLTTIANAFALGLASTVLYFGALADRYGRKLMFVLGAILTVPTAFISAFAPNVEILVLGRFTSGLAAALLFPTTLSLISSLYKNHAKVAAIALWSGVGGGVAALGPVMGGWMLEYFWWGSVFLIAVPLVVVALVIGLVVLPWKSDEEVKPIDHIGGILSIIGVLLLVITIEQVADGLEWSLLWTFLISLVFLGLFFWRQSRAPSPLIYLPLLKARTMWVAFLAGSITFGSLIGAMFIGQQYSQNVLGYSTLLSALVVVPTAIGTMIFGQIAGKLVIARGSRLTFSLGLTAVAIAFVVILITWTETANIGWVITAYALVGVGVGLSVTPASRALMGSVPPARSGMGSAFLDLTRDLGGAIIQATMGTFLAAAYAISVRAQLTALPESEATKVTDTVSQELASSYSSAAQVAEKYSGSTSEAILAGATEAFTDGKSLAIGVALVLTLIGLVVVAFVFPSKEKENAYYEKIQAQTD
jgi:EmrB/QacA subfamily drug resistance transporter